MTLWALGLGDWGVIQNLQAQREFLRQRRHTVSCLHPTHRCITMPKHAS